MRINEVKQPSEKAINESVERGEITECMGKILKTHSADQWSAPMTLEEALSEDQRILAEAGIRWTMLFLKPVTCIENL